MKKMTRKARPLFKSSNTASATTGALSTTSTSSSSSGGGILRRTTWADKIRDKLPPLEENEYEVLWERGVLGVIFLESERDGIPYVSKATETCISPEVQPGDTLKFVNIVRSKDHSFSDFFKILATMKKPVLLRFERANAGTPTSDDEMGAGAGHPGFDQRSNSSSSLGSTSSPDSSRGSKYQRANSVPPNDQQTPAKGFNARGAFWRSSSGRDSTIPPSSSSHPAPAPRDGDDGSFRASRAREVSPQHTPNGSVRTPQEAAYQEYEVYWETGSLGLFFGEDRLTNLPVVTRSTPSANAVVQRMVAVNDTLVSANGIQSRDYTFDSFFSRLQQMNKPVRLVFRRPRREPSPGKMMPDRKPVMMVDTDLSPGGTSLRDRHINGSDSPLSGRADTPPLPPSPQVNVALNQQYQRESDGRRSPPPHASFTTSSSANQERVSSKGLIPPTTADSSGASRKSRALPSPGMSRVSPKRLNEAAHRQRPSSTAGSLGTRSSAKVLKDDPYDRLSSRVSERRGGSAHGTLETSFRMSSKTSSHTTSPQHSDATYWSTAGPSPTIHTALDDSDPKAKTPLQTKPRPSPIETSGSYKDLFGSPSPADKTQVSPTNIDQGREVAAAKASSPSVPAKPASPVPPTPPVVPAEPVAPAEPVQLSSPPKAPLSTDIWSMAAEEPAEELSSSREAAHDERAAEMQDDRKSPKLDTTSANTAEEDESTVSLNEDTRISDNDRWLKDATIGEEQDVANVEAVDDAADARATSIADSTGGVSASETLSISSRLSSEDAPDDIHTGEIAEVEVGIIVDADDEYQVRDEVDVSGDGFGDDDKKQPDILDMDTIGIGESAPVLASGTNDDSDDSIVLRMEDSKPEIVIDVDTKVDDRIDDDTEGLSPLVSDPDISSDVDVVAAGLMDEASKIKDDAVTNLPKANKPALTANLAKYKKKGKSGRGVTKLPALGEAEALTVPLVAPNAVNTTIQVRGRPKPKQTMMDTPDGATYLVKWKENRSIGLQLKEVRFAKGTYPLVTDVCQEPCCEALKHICIGDVIVEINGKNTSSMGVKKTVNFLKSCSKTTLMKLRHGPSYVSQRVSAYM